MAPKRILFVAEAVTVTHVGRMLYLASRLDRTAYTPLLAWDPRFNHLLGELPAPFYPIFSIPSHEFLKKLASAWPIYDFNTLERYVNWDLEIFREARPDAVVGDFRMSLPISAQVTGVPYLNVINAHWSPYASARFVVPDSPLVRTFGAAFPQFLLDVARPFFFRSYALEFNRLSTKFGRPTRGTDLRQIYCEGDRTLYPDLPEVVPTRNLPPTHRYLGPVVWSPPLPVPSFLSDRRDGHPLVYVNLGTSGDSQLLPRLLDILTRRNLRVAAATGGRSDVTSPSNQVHVADFLPGDAACRAADLVVFNGGSAGGQQALLAGVPVLGIPSNLDQHLNMHFLKRAGVGECVRSDGASERALTRAIDHLLTHSAFREKARALGERAGAWRPAEVLRDVLDDLFQERPAVTPKSSSSTFILDPRPPKVWAPATVPFSLPEARDLAEAGRLAPSVANTQPFRFEWDGAWLGIHLDPDRANPFLNFFNTDTWVNLGILLENLHITAAGRGQRLEVDFLPEDARNGQVARVRPASSLGQSVPGSELALYVAARATNRQPHEARPVPPAMRQQLLSCVREDEKDVRIDWLENPALRDSLANAFAVYNQIVFEIPVLRAALVEWLRLSESDSRQSMDGLSLESLELGRLARFVFRMTCGSPWASLLAKLGVFGLYRVLTTASLRHTSAFVAFRTTRPNPEGIAQAGQVAERMWLMATRMGLAVHPLAGLTYLVSRQPHLEQGLSLRHQRMTQKARDQLIPIIPKYADEGQLLVFRIGFAGPPSERSPRRPLENMFLDRSSPPPAPPASKA